jgi:hypothetical protein
MALLRKSTSPRWGEVNRMRGLIQPTTIPLYLRVFGAAFAGFDVAFAIASIRLTRE